MKVIFVNVPSCKAAAVSFYFNIHAKLSKASMSAEMADLSGFSHFRRRRAKVRMAGFYQVEKLKTRK